MRILSVDRCTQPSTGSRATDEPAAGISAHGWTIKDLAQFMGVDWPPSDDAPALDTLAYECGDDRTWGGAVDSCGTTSSVPGGASQCVGFVDDVATTVRDDGDDACTMVKAAGTNNAKGTHPCDSIDIARPCKRARVESGTETMAGVGECACAEEGCDMPCGLTECTHGMCPAHCRRRQRTLGAIRGRCAHPMHAVVDWYRPCDVRGCSGRAGMGCAKDLCAVHCARAAVAAAAPNARPCRSRSHRGAAHCLYRRRHAAAYPRPTTASDGLSSPLADVRDE
ncbi:hypothetical protein pkur_cds_611 [Pandoravirus kuranda]|uniref:Uncharacterized protein n=1 Tax=Pandoravirus kuranda TaxID=3019033 RepID=A0AA95EF15_9VIRU|nr:hypothetical protein pkur_cds_611 [Pandoravirus kuranda]